MRRGVGADRKDPVALQEAVPSSSAALPRHQRVDEVERRVARGYPSLHGGAIAGSGGDTVDLTAIGLERRGRIPSDRRYLRRDPAGKLVIGKVQPQQATAVADLRRDLAGKIISGEHQPQERCQVSDRWRDRASEFVVRKIQQLKPGHSAELRRN